jgi:hypothetical protein
MEVFLMKNLLAWPFLISRNKLLDYRPITVPDFIAKAGAANLLLKHATGDIMEHSQLTISDPRLGDMTIAYHVIPAMQGNQHLTDGYGREIDRIEGIVLEGNIQAKVSKQIIHRAQQIVEDDFLEFWQQSQPPSVKGSQAFNIEQKGAHLVPLERLTPNSAQSLQPAQVNLNSPDYSHWLPHIIIGLFFMVILLAISIMYLRGQIIDLHQHIVNLQQAIEHLR